MRHALARREYLRRHVTERPRLASRCHRGYCAFCVRHRTFEALRDGIVVSQSCYWHVLAMAEDLAAEEFPFELRKAKESDMVLTRLPFRWFPDEGHDLAGDPPCQRGSLGKYQAV